jgi:hypothetical protein
LLSKAFEGMLMKEQDDSPHDKSCLRADEPSLRVANWVVFNVRRATEVVEVKAKLLSSKTTEANKKSSSFADATVMVGGHGDGDNTYGLYTSGLTPRPYVCIKSLHFRLCDVALLDSIDSRNRIFATLEPSARRPIRCVVSPQKDSVCSVHDE